jgi:hypothetical protein
MSRKMLAAIAMAPSGLARRSRLKSKINGALAQGAAGTRNLPTAQAALLTPIRDERDPTTPTRRPCNPLPLEKSHIA